MSAPDPFAPLREAVLEAQDSDSSLPPHCIRTSKAFMEHIALLSRLLQEHDAAQLLDREQVGADQEETPRIVCPVCQSLLRIIDKDTSDALSALRSVVREWAEADIAICAIPAHLAKPSNAEWRAARNRQLDSCARLRELVPSPKAENAD